MKNIYEIYEANHIKITIIFIIFIIYLIYNTIKKKALINNLNRAKKEILKLSAIINNYEKIEKENSRNKIKLGSIVKIKYLILNEVIEITLTENINSNSNSNKINIKMPLAISLLDRKKGEIVKFQNDNAEEIFIEILEVKSK